MVIPEVFNTDEESSVGLMTVNNIDNMENTLIGAGKSVYSQTKNHMVTK